MMAQPDVGPNDIVIHLINPYRCSSCGTEFCTRSVFLEHLGDHIDKIKSGSPCSQVSSGVNIVEQREDGITVTRDVLQINENQIFELQDPNLDYSQLAPLRALEQAGILSLPKPPQRERSVEPGRISKLSLKTPVHQIQPAISSDQPVPTTVVSTDDSGPLTVTQSNSSPGLLNLSGLDVIVQQALFNDTEIKEEYSVMIEPPPEGFTENLSEQQTESLIAQVKNNPDLVIDEKSVVGKRRLKPVCSICLNEFSNHHALERHQVVHTGAKPHRCNTCLKQFNDISSVRRHSLIHNRQHRCPICHKLYLRRAHLMMHMKHHGKKRFIQFGDSLHEVSVKMSRNDLGQIIQEYTLATSGPAQKEGEEEGTEESQGETSEITDKTCEEIATESIPLEENKATSEKGWDPVTEDQAIEILDSTTDVGPAKKKSILYRCGHCKKMIYTRPTLSRHLIRHTNKKPFTCLRCLKCFTEKLDLVNHLKTHIKPIKCTTCNSSFSKNLYLDRHIIDGCPLLDKDTRFEVLPDMRCRCTKCDKIFKSKAHIMRHLRIHAFNERQKGLESQTSSGPGEKDPEEMERISENVDDHYEALEGSVGFKCHFCGFELRYRSFMRTHILMHLKIKPYSCNECPKAFYSRHKLRKHMNNHTRPYKCPVCGKGFIRRYLMREHHQKAHEEGGDERMVDITVLEDKKQIMCDICGKTMPSFHKSLMMSHIRLHKDVRPYNCTICQKKFSSENALKKHTMNHTKPYVCPVCKKGFSRRYILTEHFKKSCSKRKGVPLTQENLSEISKGKLQLADIGNLNTSESQIILDTTDQTDTSTGPYQPTIITQINTETGEEKFTCEPCDKHFKAYDTLLKHVQRFARATACKHCGQVFEDKHLTTGHQRSCLGPSATPSRSVVKKSKSPGAGENQVKVQVKMREMDDKISQLQEQEQTVPPALTSDVSQVSETETDLDNTTDVEEQTSRDNIAEDQSDTVVTPSLNGIKESSDVEETLSSTKRPPSASTPSFGQKKGEYPCPQCSRKFTTVRGLKIHANSHVRLFKCEDCGKDFTHIDKFRQHSLKHEKNNSVQSEEAGESQGPGTVEATSTSTAMSEQDNDEEKSTPVQASKTPSRVAKRAVVVGTPERRAGKKPKPEEDDDDSDGEKMAELELKHRDIVEVNQKLMNSGTRGRPFSCQSCRRRFTEQAGLDAHMAQIHGVHDK